MFIYKFQAKSQCTIDRNDVDASEMSETKFEDDLYNYDESEYTDANPIPIENEISADEIDTMGACMKAKPEDDIDTDNTGLSQSVDRTSKASDELAKASQPTAKRKISGISVQTIGSLTTNSVPSMSSPNLMRKVCGTSQHSHRSHTDHAVHTYGVDTNRFDELDRLMRTVDLWGIDVFLIDELTVNRPLTAVAYSVFHVGIVVTNTFCLKSE
jgi:hypothetical protein